MKIQQNLIMYGSRDIFNTALIILPSPAGMYGLPRPWYFPLQRSYWLGSGRVETWEWPWGGGAMLSVMEEDQACAMEHRRSGEVLHLKALLSIQWLNLSVHP